MTRRIPPKRFLGACFRGYRVVQTEVAVALQQTGTAVVRIQGKVLPQAGKRLAVSAHVNERPRLRQMVNLNFAHETSDPEHGEYRRIPMFPSIIRTDPADPGAPQTRLLTAA